MASWCYQRNPAGSHPKNLYPTALEVAEAGLAWVLSQAGGALVTLLVIAQTAISLKVCFSASIATMALLHNF